MLHENQQIAKCKRQNKFSVGDDMNCDKNIMSLKINNAIFRSEGQLNALP